MKTYILKYKILSIIFQDIIEINKWGFDKSDGEINMKVSIKNINDIECMVEIELDDTIIDEFTCKNYISDIFDGIEKKYVIANILNYMENDEHIFANDDDGLKVGFYKNVIMKTNMIIIGGFNSWSSVSCASKLFNKKDEDNIVRDIIFFEKNHTFPLNKEMNIFVKQNIFIRLPDEIKSLDYIKVI